MNDNKLIYLLILSIFGFLAILAENFIMVVIIAILIIIIFNNDDDSPPENFSGT